MTREEAIDLLDNLIGAVEDNHGSDYDGALKMAIKALEQEPCEDAISRQAVEDAIAETLIYGEELGDSVAHWIVDDLPLVTPKVKTGHWVYDNEYSDWYDVTYRCSCCNRPIIISSEVKNDKIYKDYPYCHCGAKMVAESEEK